MRCTQTRMTERQIYTSKEIGDEEGAGLGDAAGLVRPSKPNAASWFANLSSLWRLSSAASILKEVKGWREKKWRSRGDRVFEFYLINWEWRFLAGLGFKYLRKTTDLGVLSGIQLVAVMLFVVEFEGYWRSRWTRCGVVGVRGTAALSQSQFTSLQFSISGFSVPYFLERNVLLQVSDNW